MIGKTISHYKILEKLGEGGMGVVYKAQDTRLDRLVAIKVLAGHLSADQDAKCRFIHEAKAASAVEHTHIAAVHDIDETPDGEIFIVMGYYPGQTLRDRVAAGSLPIDDALSLTSQVAAGLAEAHAKGIVHRDVKPANVIVSESGQVKIVDFGLAKLREVTKITKSGTTVGTLAYMSPEQVRGAEVDARSDIFSLGCVLYELVTGRPPFAGDHDAAIVYAITNEDPSSIAKYRSGIPDGIQRIVDKALAKSPDERYQSVGELKEDVDALRSGSGEVWPSAAGKRKRVLSWAALFLVVAIAAAAIWKNRRDAGPPEAKAQSLAIVDFRDTANPAGSAFSAGITGLLQVGLVESSPCRLVSSEYLYDLRRRLFGSAAGPVATGQALEIARGCGATILLSGQRYGEGTNQFVTWQLVDTNTGASLGARRVDGEGMSALADGIISGVLPLLSAQCGVASSPVPTPVTNLTTESQDAYEHYLAGMDAASNSRRENAIRELEAAVGIDSTFALAWFGLARVHGGFRSHGGPKGKVGCDAGERAWALRSRLGIKDRMLLEAWLARDCRGDIPGAIVTHREIVARWPDDREALGELSGMLLWIHMGGEAVPVAQGGLQRYPNDQRLKENLAHGLATIGRLEEAITLHKHLAAASPDNPNHWDNVALGYLGLGMPDSAEAAWQRALETDPEWIWGDIGKAVCPFFRGELDKTIYNLRRLERSEIGDAAHREILVGDFGLAHLLAEGGQYGQALAIIDSTLEDSSSRGNNLVSYINFLLSPEPEYHDELTDHLRSVLDELENAQTRTAVYLARRAIVSVALALDSVEVARPRFEAMRDAGVIPLNSYWWRWSAEFSLADGRPTDALRYFEKIEQTGIKPGTTFDIMRRTNIARAYGMLDRYQEAAATLEELSRLYKAHWVAQYGLGQVYEKLGRSDDAIAAYGTFLDGWSEADPGLGRVADVRERLAALR